MPFRSQTQRRKMFALAERGEISRETVNEFQRATGKRKLPERVRPKRPDYIKGKAKHPRKPRGKRDDYDY